MHTTVEDEEMSGGEGVCGCKNSVLASDYKASKTACGKVNSATKSSDSEDKMMV